MKTIKISILYFFLGIVTFGFSQNKIKSKVHSHNDYLKTIPFWDAYSAEASSIEVDLFLKNNTLFATHDEKEIQEERTFENLYLEPLQKAYDLGLGKNQDLILLIDIKSEAYTTLEAIIKSIEKHQSLIKNKKIKFVISGNRPKVSDYPKYPDFIFFDYQSLNEDLTQKENDKIALISLNFKNYLKWNGQKNLTDSNYLKIKELVKTAHSFNKPFRFWGIPDTEISWKLFSEIGVDYINTDYAFKCISFLKNPYAQDWANLNRFKNENNQLPILKPNEKRIVFMGNSITEGWLKKRPEFFANKSYINRGISGQTTPQMLLRFKQDVINLKPKAVIILAGINDIAGNTGPSKIEMILENIQSMVALSKANGIKVILCSVLPAYDFPWRKGLEPAEKVVQLNSLLEAYANKNDLIYVDYFTEMVNNINGLKEELTYDGVHPNKNGYLVMEPILQAAINKL